MATKEIFRSKGSERLRSQNPVSANYMTDPHILFIPSAVNTLASGRMPATHPKRLRGSTACIKLPASQTPAYIPNLILSIPPGGSLMREYLSVCFLGPRERPTINANTRYGREKCHVGAAL